MIQWFIMNCSNETINLVVGNKTHTSITFETYFYRWLIYAYPSPVHETVNRSCCQVLLIYLIKHCHYCYSVFYLLCFNQTHCVPQLSELSVVDCGKCTLFITFFDASTGGQWLQSSETPLSYLTTMSVSCVNMILNFDCFHRHLG